MKPGREFRLPRMICGAVLAMLLNPSMAPAAGGTSQVAAPERPVAPEPHWPAGIAALLNDPARTEGWNPWFTEWANDVKHYEFEVQNLGDLNRVIQLFAAVESDRLQIWLSPAAEPRGLGWASQLPEGNDTPVLFSLGDQHRISQWFKGLGGNKFGVIEFEQVPRAVPPTLALYVQNEAIDLNRLQIPRNIKVSFGNGPGIFHQWNRKRPDESGDRKPPSGGATPDAETVRAAEQIRDFLQERAREPE